MAAARLHLVLRLVCTPVTPFHYTASRTITIDYSKLRRVAAVAASIC